MDKRFPPPSDDDLTTVYLCSEIVFEKAKAAGDSGDHEGVRVAEGYYRYHVKVYCAMLERQRGATVH